MSLVCLAHGRESGPRGTKLDALAAVACRRGWQVERPDFRGIPDPDERVALLLETLRRQEGKVVLAGSSMGGYVATVAAATLDPCGLFLMAPAFYLPGYRVQEPEPGTVPTVVVHGWYDDVVPAAHAIRFVQRRRAQLHLLDDGHRLQRSIPFLEAVFDRFLDGIEGEGGGR